MKTQFDTYANAINVSSHQSLEGDGGRAHTFFLLMCSSFTDLYYRTLINTQQKGRRNQITDTFQSSLTERSWSIIGDLMLEQELRAEIERPSLDFSDEKSQYFCQLYSERLKTIYGYITYQHLQAVEGFVDFSKLDALVDCYKTELRRKDATAEHLEAFEKKIEEFKEKYGALAQSSPQFLAPESTYF